MILVLGRERERQAARDLLLRPEVRLLTLIGAPGVGKTRLAQTLGADVLEAFTHGVCFVSLASIRDPALVGSTIAHTLGLHEIGNHSLVDSPILMCVQSRKIEASAARPNLPALTHISISPC